MLKKISAKIPTHITLLVKLYVANLLLFFIIRALFYFVNKTDDTTEVVFFEKLMAFRMGLEFDTAVFSWIMYVPVLFWSLAYLLRKNLLYTLGFYFFLCLQCVYIFICIANIPYFSQFGTHLNRNAFLWNDDPSFAAGVIFGSFYYWGYFLIYFPMIFILWIFNHRHYTLFTQQEAARPKVKWYFALLAFIVLVALVSIGARGRTSDRSGLHEGLAIVSQNNFINQIAINPNYTFWKTVLYNKNKKSYLVPQDIDEHISFTRSYLGITAPFVPNIERIVIDTSTIKTKYNIVIIVMESMSVFKMGYYNGKNLTPYLHELNKKSIFCEKFFSSGIHTFNGLFSTSTGYISILAEKSMKSYVKEPFSGLGPLLKQQGYENYFYTTHDPHFDNMEGFFTLNKFDHCISQYDFESSQAESSLGVPDHLLFDKLLQTTNERKLEKPFLSVLMTASDHGPWRIPTDISFKPEGKTPQENCTLYADWAIGRFMKTAQKQRWFNNTVFIFLGDHGLSMGHTYEMPLSYNHVPCIIYQPMLFKPDTIKTPCYQPDIPATVMGILKTNYTNNTFGINILKEKHPYVVFSADDKIGCIDSNGFYYYKTLSNDQTYLRKYKVLDKVNYNKIFKTKADSMEKNLTHIYETGNYLIRKNYFLYE